MVGQESKRGEPTLTGKTLPLTLLPLHQHDHHHYQGDHYSPLVSKTVIMASKNRGRAKTGGQERKKDKRRQKIRRGAQMSKERRGRREREWRRRKRCDEELWWGRVWLGKGERWREEERTCENKWNNYRGHFTKGILYCAESSLKNTHTHTQAHIPCQVAPLSANFSLCRHFDEDSVGVWWSVPTARGHGIWSLSVDLIVSLISDKLADVCSSGAACHPRTHTPNITPFNRHCIALALCAFTLNSDSNLGKHRLAHNLVDAKYLLKYASFFSSVCVLQRRRAADGYLRRQRGTELFRAFNI